MYKRICILLFVLIAIAACGAPAPTAAPTAVPVAQPTATAVALVPTNPPVPTATSAPALAEYMTEEGYWTTGKADAKVLFVDSSDFA